MLKLDALEDPPRLEADKNKVVSKGGAKTWKGVVWEGHQ